MKKLLMAIILFTGLFLMFSCEYEYIQPDIPLIPDEVSFSEDIVPIFTKSCNAAVCHDVGGAPPDLTPQNAYLSLTNGGYLNLETPNQSSLYVSLKTGSMKGYAQPGDAEFILAWITQGAKNN